MEAVMADETTHHRRGEQPRCARVERVLDTAVVDVVNEVPQREEVVGAHERHCNHSRSLHGGDKNPGRCKAMGCWCPGFVEAQMAGAL
jgi:hypothetical protein